MHDIKTKGLAAYYSVNALKHYKAICEIIEKDKVDRIVISNLLSGYVAANASKNKIKGIFDLSDYFPASGAGYYSSFNSVLGKSLGFALEELLKKTLQITKNTVTCSYALRDYVKRLGIANVSVITNGVDDFFLSHRSDGEEIRQKYALNGYVTIGYIGSIEFWLDLTPLLQAMRNLKNRKVKLFLVGANLRTGIAKSIQTQINDLGIEKNVVWLKDFVPYSDVPNYIGAMDICTIPFDCRNPTAFYSSPNKLWEYLALRRPVITTPIPDPIIQAGKFVDVATTSQDYQKIIEDYLRDPDKYKQKASEADQLIKERTWAKMAEKYEQTLENLN